MTDMHAMQAQSKQMQNMPQCPRYVAIRAQFGGLFDGAVKSAVFFNGLV